MNRTVITNEMKNISLLFAALVMMSCEKDDPAPRPQPSNEPDCECIYAEYESNEQTNFEWVTVVEEPIIHYPCEDSLIEYTVIPYPDGEHAWKYFRGIGCD